MLRIHFSDNRQAPIWLVDERLTIGQDSRNNLVLADAGISPFHAEIRQDHGYYYLTDCGSQVGTWVNDERITARYQLRTNDCVRIGVVELVFVDPTKSKAQSGANARWFLQVVKGEHEGKKFHVNGSMTFGRSTKCELCFSDMELSRRHCEFFLKDDVLEIKDLASANGVRVNQQKVATAVLQPGDQLKMGSVTLLVIGPKTAVAQAEDEDATVFMRAVDLPKPGNSKPQVSRAGASNPLRSAVPLSPVPVDVPRKPGFNSRLLTAVAVILAGVAATLAFNSFL
ncbi:type III secretion system (T3SS) inner membrane Yop/YscD-like protein [Pseudomonas sp. SJZ079]|uniref:FHA domain-containing protein n=1 Tax=Pseudomonas sp. SJZ079 TaxID=2572887 RepID=UPI0011994F0B|nr:FHA domain-containing protein [Pseudomonas sp. SJZ079]TWC43066.1 type III secretion system (T3SS) inner membrane Yop/YscD-like protein [Pseudomonas sp. SJZ079]